VYIGNALSPAKVMNVRLDEVGDARTATVIVPDRQLSLAIGKEGQNARLAAKLTGWRIDIKSATETAEETLGKLTDRVIPPEEMGLLDLADAILQKHDSTGFSAEEEQLAAAVVEEGSDAGLAWPEQGPSEAAGVRPLSEAEPARAREAAQQMAGVAGAPGAREPVPAGISGDQPAATQAGGEEPAVVPAESGLPMPEVAPSSRRALDLEQEQLPTFEGEPVEESSGWVQAAPQDELYSGWEEAIEQAPEDEEEWDREELGEELPPAAGKKKKKSGKSRFGRGRDRE
jgi:hypothetical protein